MRNYSESYIERGVTMNLSKREPISIRLSTDTVACINDYASTLNMTRTDVIETLLMFSVKYLAYKKQERRCCND